MLQSLARIWMAAISALLLVASLFVALAEPAEAVFPGRNGLIALTIQRVSNDRFYAYPDIYTVRPDGHGLRRLTFNGNSYDPAWGPGGYRILYSHGYDDIWIMGGAGRHKARVTGPGGDPSWAPGGHRFVFVSGRSGTAQLYIYNFDTKRTTQITQRGDPVQGSRALHPSWSPLGDRILMR